MCVCVCVRVCVCLRERESVCVQMYKTSEQKMTSLRASKCFMPWMSVISIPCPVSPWQTMLLTFTGMCATTTMCRLYV